MTAMFSPPVEDFLIRKEPFLWINDNWLPLQAGRSECGLDLNDVRDVESRMSQFSGLLMKLFPELTPTGGIIESDLLPADSFQRAKMKECRHPGRWLVKCDHALPIAGSIKARGGIYEVLAHAENLALQNGLWHPDDDRLVLASDSVRKLFARHRVVVGSTGNLGLSIGVMAAALGFQSTVHMSSDAKEWKKSRLRSLGVDIVEHRGDFGVAVAAGRRQAQQDESEYFIDDENSRHLFLGYSVAAPRLVEQLAARDVRVDTEHPPFVYLPCGVGGAAGGITFGLRHLLGDNVHCFFAEPAVSPCMLIRLASTRDLPISVGELGLDNCTEADGLAVGKASDFVVPFVRSLVSGIFTVRDNELFEDLYLLERTEGMRIEPSAAAALRGPRWVLESAAGRGYLEEHDLLKNLDAATHSFGLPVERSSRPLNIGDFINGVQHWSANPEIGKREPHPSTISSRSFMISNKWYGSLGLASNVKCS
jgi:D-serine dehydratase